jgi:hypothetical protein
VSATERECFDPGPIDFMMHCPFCPVSVGYSADPDSAFNDLLAHIGRWHATEDQTPAVLWPKIEVEETS